MSYNSYKDGVEFRYNNRTGCFVICEEALKWSCVDGKCVQKLDGEFLTEEECNKYCTKVNKKWTCSNNGQYYKCIESENGEFNSKVECLKSGCGWYCDKGINFCRNSKSEGKYFSQDQCANSCNKNWIVVYDDCLCKSEAKSEYCDKNCGCRYTTYVRGKGESNDNKGTTMYELNCLPKGGIGIQKYNDKYHYTFIQFLSPPPIGIGQKACGYYCKGSSKSDGFKSSDFRWAIDFNYPKGGEFSLRITTRNKDLQGCPFSLAVFKGQNNITSPSIIDIPNNEKGNNAAYTGNLDEKYKIFMLYKGENCNYKAIINESSIH